MASYNEMEQLCSFFQDKISNRILFIVSNDAGYSFDGQVTAFSKCFIFLIDKSMDNVQSVSSQEIAQKMQTWVFESANKTKQQTADYLYDMLKDKYPNHKTGVFVWDKDQMEHTGWKNSKGSYQFKCSNNAAYGHDVVLMIS